MSATHKTKCPYCGNVVRIKHGTTFRNHGIIDPELDRKHRAQGYGHYSPECEGSGKVIPVLQEVMLS